MADQATPFPRRPGVEPWPQPATAPRDDLVIRPEPRQLYTMRLCGPSTEGEDVDVVPGVPIGVIATALLLLQPGDVATIECTEGQ